MKDSTLIKISIFVGLIGIVTIALIDIPVLERTVNDDDDLVKIAGHIVDMDVRQKVTYIWVERTVKDKVVCFEDPGVVPGDEVALYARYDGELILDRILKTG